MLKAKLHVASYFDEKFGEVVKQHSEKHCGCFCYGLHVTSYLVTLNIMGEVEK